MKTGNKKKLLTLVVVIVLLVVIAFFSVRMYRYIFSPARIVKTAIGRIL